MKSNQQSLRRRLIRGNAILSYSELSKSIEVVNKRGSEANVYNHAFKNREKLTEDSVINNYEKSHIPLKDRVSKNK